ncbi:bifunctional pyr operon transcriptional regulator/uracil phosphoribosyltransferase PyrR [Flammeovirga pectinis]|uniref:Bifunctional pyr operon transcriptional regulator/uracil phosphoribosyltransferase PyrR n=1 Tax=Flammeovirga pectinis TaxID=2494373 RepID=A0A3Q9FNG4_9BACT|nr:bifunctional pyr operon transcriptional regulator/uracil phosphoribosyltransferase PyrR [Flammeovirga pectinis]AZQ62253.1 bifunctional pyr operon transcriptional regulator/uracil phosphoribosyltransferase PyrR [Flammeovirga pectinis]
MAKVSILHSQLLDITISRLSQQLIENHGDFSNTVIIGLQQGGIILSDRIRQRIFELSNTTVPVGQLDITFHRDDFRRGDNILTPSKTDIPFLIEDMNVILIDDVVFTGRSIRSALDAMMAFGRPSKVELLCLVDRKYSRDLPIEPTYVGKVVNSIQSQYITAEWKEEGHDEDTLWLINK